MLEGFEANQETLGFWVIRQAGIGGNRLMHPHTAENLRKESYLPDVVKSMS